MSTTPHVDPEKDRRFFELSAEARRIGEQPDIGEPEVRRMQAIFEEMQKILEEADPSIRVRRELGRYHPRQGRAVDYPPSPALIEWITRHRWRPPGWPFHTQQHIHWAQDDPS